MSFTPRYFVPSVKMVNFRNRDPELWGPWWLSGQDEPQRYVLALLSADGVIILYEDGERRSAGDTYTIAKCEQNIREGDWAELDQCPF